MTVHRLLALCALSLLAFAPLVAQADPGETQAVRALLGPRMSAAKIAGGRDAHVIVVDLASWAETDLGDFSGGEEFATLSRVWWNRDGEKLVFAHRRKAYVAGPDGAAPQQVLVDQPAVFEPSWWRDPSSGEDCIVFTRTSGKFWYPRHAKTAGGTFLYRPSLEQITKIAGFPCGGGLSLDGTHLGEAYGGCLIVDLPRSEYHILYDGKQACNPSMSPDNTYRLMHLYLPHDHFGFRNQFDKELWSIKLLPGTSEWQTPRWSNVPDFCMATTKVGDRFVPVLVQISTGKTVILHSLGGGWRAPHLWLPPASTSTPQEAQAASLQEARKKLQAAREAADALEARALYREVASTFAGTAPGARAQKTLTSADFQREVAAARILHTLLQREGQLAPVKNAAASYGNAAYYERNRAVLNQMVKLVTRLRTDFQNTEALRGAEEIAGRYQLPVQQADSENETLCIVGTVEAVSNVPSPEQIAPYKEAVTYILYRVDQVLSGHYDRDKIVVVHWGMRNRKLTAAAGWAPGLKQRLTLDLFDAHEKLAEITAAQNAYLDFELVPFWALQVETAS